MYNVALIGCGRWGSNHLDMLLQQIGSSIENLYVVDSKAMDNPSIEHIFEHDEFDHVLEFIDIAVIATPNELHVPQAIKCIDRGIHVLVEKPLSTSIAELEALIQHLSMSPSTVHVGYLLNSHPAVVAAEQHLFHDTIQYLEFTRYTTRTKPEHANILDSFLVHALALCIHLGLNINVQHIDFKKEGIEHTLKLQASNGADVHFRVGWDAQQEHRTIQIHALKNRIDIDFGDPGLLMLNGIKQPTVIMSALQAQWQQFLAKIAMNQTLQPGTILEFQQAYNNLFMALSIL
jgi:hypothetical protein